MSWEPLSDIIADDPYSCVVYDKKFNLRNTQGGKQLKRHARTARRLMRALKKSKSRQAKPTKGTNVDGKFQETMHMPYNLMSRMATPNGRMLLT